MSKILTVGFFGNGKSAHRYQAPFILRRPDKFKIKAMCARHKDNPAWEKIPGVNYTDNEDDILLDDEIDLVILSLPHHLHYEYAKKVLNAGKHCLVEKPFTNTVAEAKELYALAKEKGLVIQCYQNRRFDSDFLTTKAVIESGKLGKLSEVEMHYDYYRPEVPESVKEFKPYMSYLYGHACHTLDQVVSYFGKPNHVVYDVRQLLGEGRMNDYFDLDLFYDFGKVSVKSSYFRVVERPSFVAYGLKGSFTKVTKDRQEEHLKAFYMPTSDHKDFGIDEEKHYGTLTYDNGSEIVSEKVKTVDGDYSRYFDALYETIVNGKEKLVKDEETLCVMEMLEEGIKLCK